MALRWFLRKLLFNSAIETGAVIMNMIEQRSKSPVLVVDDDPITAWMLEQMFVDAGFPTQFTTNPLQVPDLLHSFRPLVITLDIDMPGKNGLDLLREIRETRRFVSVIIISAHTTFSNRVKAFNLGADFIIPKPINDPAHLIDYADRCIARMEDWITEMNNIRRLESSPPSAADNLAPTPDQLCTATAAETSEGMVGE